MLKPNFTGRWKFNPKRSSLEIPPPDSAIFVVEHREPIVRLSRTHIIGGKSDSFEINLTTDGKEVEVAREGLKIRARAYWEDDTLVFDSHVSRGDQEGSNIVRYTLNDTHDSFVGQEQFRSQNLNYDNIWVLERQRTEGDN